MDELTEWAVRTALWTTEELAALCCGQLPNGVRTNTAEQNISREAINDNIVRETISRNTVTEEIRRAGIAKLLVPVESTTQGHCWNSLSFDD